MQMVFQLGSALLDVCVLAILARQDSYGYSLTSELKNVMSISESTLYPVLRRLQKEGLLTTYDQAYQGRNRRYYRITQEGVNRLREYQEEWRGFKAKLDRILEEGIK
jgi:PadR family transcriptional regulator PadR